MPALKPCRSALQYLDHVGLPFFWLCIYRVVDAGLKLTFECAVHTDIHPGDEENLRSLAGSAFGVASQSTFRRNRPAKQLTKWQVRFSI